MRKAGKTKAAGGENCEQRNERLFIGCNQRGIDCCETGRRRSLSFSLYGAFRILFLRLSDSQGFMPERKKGKRSEKKGFAVSVGGGGHGSFGDILYGRGGKTTCRSCGVRLRYDSCDNDRGGILLRPRGCDRGAYRCG